MSRSTPAAWWRKPAAAAALAALLAPWAAADVPLGSTTTTGRTPAATAAPAAGTTTAASPTAGPLADILALATVLADELNLSFSDPLDEMEFFFAVAELYFQVLRQQRHQAPAAGSTASGTTAKPTAAGGTTARPTAGSTIGSALGSLTSVAK